MPTKSSIIKPDPRENKTTIQITKEIKEILTKIGLKGETYNQVITRLISDFEKHNKDAKKLLESVKYDQSGSKQIKISDKITISKYERVTISIKDNVNPDPESPHIGSPPITLEVSYNKPINKEDSLYQIDLKIHKIIFDNEAYSPKEFFGVLQKDIVYCEKFVYYYLKSIMKILTLEFKKSNFFFNKYLDYFELARWRTFLLNSKLSPEILSSDVESILSDLKNKKTNKKLIKDVENSYYHKIKKFGAYRPTSSGFTLKTNSYKYSKVKKQVRKMIKS